MESQQNNRPGILIAIAAGALGILSLFAPVVLMILPAFFGYLLAARPWTRGLPALGIALVGTMVLSQWPTSLYVLSIYVPASIVLAVLLRKGVGRFETIAAVAALIGAGFYVLLCVPSLVAGGTPTSLMQEQVLMMMDVVGELPADMGAAGAELDAAKESLAMVTASLNDFRLALPELMPMILCLIGSVGAVISVPLAARWSSRVEKKIRPISAFRDWRLPREFLIGALILALGCGVLVLLKLEIAQTVWMAALVLIVLPLFVQGLCTVAFLLQKSSGGKVGVIVLLVLMCLLALPFAVVILTLLGAVEQALSLRRRITEAINQNQNKN